MKRNQWMLMLGAVALVVACSGIGDSGAKTSSVGSDARPSAALNADEGDVQLALSAVPDALKNAAIGAVPGLVLVSVEQEVENGVVIYSMTGTADGVTYEVEVGEDGTVGEIETDDDDDDDGDDDDDDDDDDDEDGNDD